MILKINDKTFNIYKARFELNEHFEVYLVDYVDRVSARLVLKNASWFYTKFSNTVKDYKEVFGDQYIIEFDVIEIYKSFIKRYGSENIHLIEFFVNPNIGILL
jgi:hypothetical protein